MLCICLFEDTKINLYLSEQNHFPPLPCIVLKPLPLPLPAPLPIGG